MLATSGEGDIAEASQGHIASIALSDNSGREELILVDPANADESEHAVIKRLTSLSFSVAKSAIASTQTEGMRLVALRRRLGSVRPARFWRDSE